MDSPRRRAGRRANLRTSGTRTERHELEEALQRPHERSSTYRSLCQVV